MAMDEDVPELLEVSLPSVSFFSRDEEKKRVPITILTGFLGSGKTTLLQYILQEQHGIKIAVLMNEFGETGMVEKQLTLQKSGYLADEWIEFENGCLCCSAKNAAMLAIESLLKTKKDIDHIVIETSGMADPGPIVQRLWADEALECHAQLDGVICLIDSHYGMQRLDPSSPNYSVEAAKQVALADMIILNKIDLIQNDRTLGTLKSVLAKINPVALFDQTCYSKAPLDKVLNLGEYRNREQNAFLDLLATMNLSSPHSVNSADRKMRNFTIFLSGSNLNLERFERWLFTLLWESKISVDGREHDLSSIDLMRVKGLLTVKDEFYALQVVQTMYDLTPLSSRPADFTPHSRLVFIGVVPKEQEELIKDSFMQMVFS